MSHAHDKSSPYESGTTHFGFRDVPAGDLAVARGRQENKPGLATRLRDRLRALKAARAAQRE